MADRLEHVFSTLIEEKQLTDSVNAFVSFGEIASE